MATDSSLSASQFSVDVESKDRGNEGERQDQDDDGVTERGKAKKERKREMGQYHGGIFFFCWFLESHA